MKMRSRGGILLAAMLVFCGGTTCHAGLMLSMSSDAPDLSSLTLGQVVTFSVLLSGLEAGDAVEYLAADLELTGDIFSVPSITNGSIIPAASGVGSSSSSSLVTYFYDTLLNFDPAITNNGVFYSITAEVANPGSGVLKFQFSDSEGFDDSGLFLDPVTATGSLSFSASNAAVVPVPSSLALMGGAAFVVLAAQGVAFRRRRNVLDA